MIFDILIDYSDSLLIKIRLAAVNLSYSLVNHFCQNWVGHLLDRLLDENFILNILEMRDQVRVSKTLSYLLRHQAVKEGLKIDSAGFVSVE